MKKFLIFIGLFVIVYFTTIAVTRGIWLGVYPKLIVHNAIRPDVHTIVLGASNGECSWDDSIIPGSQNLASSGRSYISNLTSLRYAMEYNDASSSIDTVILCSGFPTFFYYTKEVLNRMDRLISDENTSLLSQKEFFDSHKDATEYWKMLFTRSPLFTTSLTPIGSFVAYDRDKLGDPRAYDVLNRQLGVVGGKDGLTESYIRENCSIQVNGIRAIKEYCDAHGLVLVLLNTPVYKIYDLVNDRGYKEFLLSEFGDSLLIADYSHFQFPDTTYYSDLEHIKYEGAKILSEHIKNNGLELQYSIDYCCN